MQETLKSCAGHVVTCICTKDAGVKASAIFTMVSVLKFLNWKSRKPELETCSYSMRAVMLEGNQRLQPVAVPGDNSHKAIGLKLFKSSG